jgi:hypothetical protein
LASSKIAIVSLVFHYTFVVFSVHNLPHRAECESRESLHVLGKYIQIPRLRPSSATLSGKAAVKVGANEGEEVNAGTSAGSSIPSVWEHIIDRFVVKKAFWFECYLFPEAT